MPTPSRFRVKIPKADRVFENFDLLAKRGLSEEQTFRGTREIVRFCNCRNVLQMSELDKVGKAPSGKKFLLG